MNLPGTPELMVIVMVALLVFGPRKLPEIGRSVGRAMQEFRRTSQEVMDTVHGAFDVTEEPAPAPKRKRVPVAEEED